MLGCATGSLILCDATKLLACGGRLVLVSSSDRAQLGSWNLLQGGPLRFNGQNDRELMLVPHRWWRRWEGGGIGKGRARERRWVLGKERKVGICLNLNLNQGFSSIRFSSEPFSHVPQKGLPSKAVALHGQDRAVVNMNGIDGAHRRTTDRRSSLGLIRQVMLVMSSSHLGLTYRLAAINVLHRRLVGFVVVAFVVVAVVVASLVVLSRVVIASFVAAVIVVCHLVMMAKVGVVGRDCAQLRAARSGLTCNWYGDCGEDDNDESGPGADAGVGVCGRGSIPSQTDEVSLAQATEVTSLVRIKGPGYGPRGGLGEMVKSARGAGERAGERRGRGGAVTWLHRYGPGETRSLAGLDASVAGVVPNGKGCMAGVRRDSHSYECELLKKTIPTSWTSRNKSQLEDNASGDK
ncbi:hypothetical protein EI94DRAFT_1700078 [Lactarius quietus]|nr:hypothetical protein EI94DRAFT_1700078 [Lactarius quietus]